MGNSLAGKVALVTGGSRGIGAATARALAAEGAAVAISYEASADKAKALVTELEKKDVRAKAFQADQSDPRKVERLVQDVVKHFGRLDVLVNNAGVFVTGSVTDAKADLAAFERQQRINVGGVAAAVRAAAGVIGEGGRIVTIGSVAGARAGYPGMADYCATKAAVAAYTRGWARDLASKKITVNVVQPGAVATDMNPDTGEFAEALKSRTALGRYGRPEEIAAVVTFLAGPSASYITGSTIDVDGGYGA